MKIWLDDERNVPPGWTGVKTAQDAINALQEAWDAGTEDVEISLDHDLGDDLAGTGNTVLVWIEERVVCEGYIPPKIHIHTANPSARQKMLLGIQSIEKLFKREEEL